MRRTGTPPRHAIDISEADGVRYLHFGSEWVQGAMRVARPWSLELDYTREMMAGLLLRDAARWPRTALLIGLGAGSLAKFIHRHFPACRITVVEINPQVEFVARQYFRLPDDPLRLDVRIGCGADYLQTNKRRFDLILSDGFDAGGRPGMLDTPAFYQTCRAGLSDDGLFCVNLLREKGFASSVDRIRSAFTDRIAVFPACASGNTIVFGRGENGVEATLGELAARAAELRARTRLNLLPTVDRLRQAGISDAAPLRL
ncbi:spermidine synthase [Azonexus fungiphilus]|jgi:spermidine synthase|uniref:Spermidine synthase n=1 Tax=Azonexus fungiphilus TaxID=146940 RepID=A0A495VKY8_9RHOO|nr:fused MFS/spermidine synthase [Azonexus fungiphilus]RKT50051.1 spermidine synthase [Azonexus fungiphilus]